MPTNGEQLTMNKNELLSKILTVCNVTNFQKVFERKVLELIEYMKQKPEEYQDILQGLEPGPPETFRLKKQGSSWICPPGIPQQIIDYILDNASPGLIAMPINFDINGHIKKVTFEMQSEGSITGTIISDGGPSVLDSPISINSADELDEVEQELLHYMRTNEAFRNYVSSELNIKWKPFIEQQNKRKLS